VSASPTRAKAQVRTPKDPEQVRKAAARPDLVLLRWPYTRLYIGNISPQHLNPRFSPWPGITVPNLQVEAEQDRVVYVWENGGSRLTAVITVEEDDGGSLINVELSHEGGDKSLSECILQDMAEELARAIASTSQLLEIEWRIVMKPPRIVILDS